GGHMVAADRDDTGVHDAAPREHGDVAGAAADVDHHHAALDLILGDHRFRRREHLQHHVVDIEARLVHHLDHVLDGGVGAGDDVRVHLETVAGHAHRIADPLLAVDGELLRQHVDDA